MTIIKKERGLSRMKESNNLLAAVLTIVGGLGVGTMVAKRDAKIIAENETLKNKVLYWQVLAALSCASSLIGWYL